MKLLSGPRKTANLSESVHQQLNMYALAASAAGVGILALAQPATAKIIYTPAHVHFGSHSFDLNHDGMPDFSITFHAYSTSSHRNQYSSIDVSGLQKANGEVEGNRGWPRAFGPGITIGPKQNFGSGGRLFLARCIRHSTATHTSTSGNWLNVKNRYLGLKFAIKGKIHYGWARLTLDGCHLFADPPLSGTLTGYAYETVPNKPIVTGQTNGPDGIVEGPDATLTAPTPQPPSLGLLAMGSPALSIWRRKESALPE